MFWSLLAIGGPDLCRDFAALTPYLEITDLQFKQVLVEFDHAIDYVYFLESAVTSTIVRTPNGVILEVGIMGAEGLSVCRFFMVSGKATVRSSYNFRDGR